MPCFERFVPRSIIDAILREGNVGKVVDPSLSVDKVVYTTSLKYK